MRVFLSVLILIFSLQCWTKADDIRDFEIEGISVGDSLLNFMTKDEIKSSISDESKYPNKKFVIVDYKKYENNNFDKLLIAIRANDLHFIIHEVKAVLNLENLTDCLIQRNEHVKIIKENFPKNTKIKRYEIKEKRDPTGESLTNIVEFKLIDGEIGVWCDYYSDEFVELTKNDMSIPSISHLAINAMDNEFLNWINTEAWND